ncbi:MULTISPECIES: TetR/AcrR family transcriptional regulator [Flavobacterium]|uniref:TetR/AcrR family transcriptional regulator n=1 Tax=Flavobacterium TaxID=237 RepID=UPI00086F2C8B|nr:MULTISPECIES: TetR/AcrR family transcriptional regulator [Flavobacterium]MBN9286054.1 TetR/AcrR family transcriptional regulator [Flavobacterium sp.]ODS90254.1 MAG: TetR family transcriptional regulator [Chryseobacterium sp. SCN 40-13]OJV68413.1 MAG: TetR family transcriptional regulator [Flavobacterium sp. 40-81]
MDKQKEILAAALKLFVEYGFHGTATSKIAKEAGVANGTLFHYYKTKEDLIIALYIDIKLKVAEHIENAVASNTDYKTHFKSQFIAIMLWSLDNDYQFRYIQQFYSSPYASQIDYEEIQKLSKKGCEELEAAIRKNVIKDLPVDYLITIVNNFIFGVQQYLRQSKLSFEAKKEVIYNSFDILWTMIS